MAFNFLRMLGGDNSTYAHHMRDARFTITRPALLAKVVEMIEQVARWETSTLRATDPRPRSHPILTLDAPETVAALRRGAPSRRRSSQMPWLREWADKIVAQLRVDL